MLITAASPSDPDIGVVAHAQSSDMRHWELQPPLEVPPIASDLECPKLHYVDDTWCLTVSVQDCIALPALRRLQGEGIVQSTAYCLTAPTMHGPYTIHGNGRILSVESSPYACEPILFQGSYYLLGTIWDDQAGDCVCDPIALLVYQIKGSGWPAIDPRYAFGRELHHHDHDGTGYEQQTKVELLPLAEYQQSHGYCHQGVGIVQGNQLTDVPAKAADGNCHTGCTQSPQ